MGGSSYYKIWINIIPAFWGAFIAFMYKCFRQNVSFGRRLRVKRNTEWKLFPGCFFSAGSKVVIGKDVTINVAPKARLTIGDNVGIGNRCQIVSHKRIEIGEGTVLAPNVMLFDHNHVFDSQNGVHQREFEDGEIVIGKNCWIGAGCIILKDVHIGDCSVIGAGSVVTKDIPSGCIAVGTPAKVIKKIE